MSIINFSLPTNLEKKVVKVIKDKGFASKAEFFRLAAIMFIDSLEHPKVSEEKKFELLSSALSHEISKKIKGKKLPPLEDQLSDV